MFPIRPALKEFVKEELTNATTCREIIDAYMLNRCYINTTMLSDDYICHHVLQNMQTKEQISKQTEASLIAPLKNIYFNSWLVYDEHRNNNFKCTKTEFDLVIVDTVAYIFTFKRIL